MSDTTAKKKFNLEERTSLFADAIIKFAGQICETTITKIIVAQLTRSGTSIGANYCEADDATSKKDFIYRIGVCKKETRETKYWLRLVPTENNILVQDRHLLLQEAKELHLIFCAIIRSGKNNV